MQRLLRGLVAALALLAGLLTVDAAPAAADLPYGPYTCANGYVWREAVPGDLVCVTPTQRDTTRGENALGPARREPNGGAWGPDTCKSGYVWRETRPSDHVCVPPASRDRARVDNSLAPYTILLPTATPTNGIAVNEVRSGYPYHTQLYTTSSFTPNKRVQFYSYDPNWPGTGHSILTLLGDVPTDAYGHLQSLTNFYGGWNITYLSCYRVATAGWLTARVVIVDQGTGIISSTNGELTAPWC
ncbi:hypothetical protein [Dactylosporangium matsuzakiense]|uniref:Secreted protein n=1 Tax=Dactylosporangium matsuzakiense TaxID=53360 RepID=A0A9W6NR90_9ACTN|nr:hypothetical protein [Dactylosporangium matsuzakiense]GLL05937.1 hypothetical protein GCM10017581_076850 [Dactylosporangium matsuzakiense]